MSGIRPHLTSITESRASGATMRRSAPRAICRPPPSALPWIAAITGTSSSAHTHAARWPVARAGPSVGGSCADADSRSPFAIARNEPKSRPAQKSGPSPERTTTRTAGSAFSSLAGVDEPLEHGRVQRVALLRPREPHVGDPVGDLDPDPLVAHARILPRSR